jgi:hypothetical protein
MVEGTLYISWANQDEPRGTRRYWVRFSAQGPEFERGAQAHKEIVGEDSLLTYLIELQAPTMTIEVRSEHAQEWVSEVISAGSLSLYHVQLNDQQFAPFRRAP